MTQRRLVGVLVVLFLVFFGVGYVLAQWPPTWTTSRTYPYPTISPNSIIDVYDYPHVCVYAGLSPTYQGQHAVTSIAVVLKSDLPDPRCR